MYRIFALTILVAGCSCQHGIGITGKSDTDTASDTISDSGPDSGSDSIIDPDDIDVELSDPSHESECGNGILEPGEECDDRNRLNGDGCDWLCRLGDGEPPPDPDPGVPVFVPDGDPVPIEDLSTRAADVERLPLVWTGSEYATAYLQPLDESFRIEVTRLGEFGDPIDSPWTYPTVSLHDGLDLVWNGMGFGLFFAVRDEGIYYLRLDSSGKPLGDPVLVEDDPATRHPAADITLSGYVLAWFTEGTPDMGWSFCTRTGYPDHVRLRIVSLSGSTAGLPGPVTVEADAGGPPDVATGASGFGVSMWVNSDEYIGCLNKFVMVSTDLSETTHSGYLSDGWAGDVHWIDEQYFTAWTHLVPGSSTHVETCVARFTPAGDLVGPPVCSELGRGDESATRFDVGERGLGILISLDTDGSDDFHLFMRTDMTGTSLPPTIALRDTGGSFPAIGPAAIAWAVMAFGTLYDDGEGLLFQRMVVE